MIDKRLAEFRLYDGLYVFVGADPVNAYDIVGQVGLSVGSKYSYSDIIAKLVKKARKGFPGADGIIVTKIDKSTLAYAVVVRFKDVAADNSKALVYSKRGVLVFSDCEPVAEFEVVKKADAASVSMYSPEKGNVADWVLKEQYGADGVIVRHNDEKNVEYVAIKFR